MGQCCAAEEKKAPRKTRDAMPRGQADRDSSKPDPKLIKYLAGASLSDKPSVVPQHNEVPIQQDLPCVADSQRTRNGKTESEPVVRHLEFDITFEDDEIKAVEGEDEVHAGEISPMQTEAIDISLQTAFVSSATESTETLEAECREAVVDDELEELSHLVETFETMKHAEHVTAATSEPTTTASAHSNRQVCSVDASPIRSVRELTQEFTKKVL